MYGYSLPLDMFLLSNPIHFGYSFLVADERFTAHFSKSFDTINQNILIRKLSERFDFSEDVLKFTNSYISNRKSPIYIKYRQLPELLCCSYWYYDELSTPLASINQETLPGYISGVVSCGVLCLFKIKDTNHSWDIT